ncbi:lactonase family protein [Cupriavidus campinensis]|uniref:Lactonase family protein n=2 Tax=Cupriavidus campinensis TaxID=151783 RepID=A0ABY3EMI6_9BURK|nr:lactonase family protein [Cupriavidus campinensis]
MFPRFSAGARAFGMALLAAAVLTACGSDDNTTPAPSATPAATKVVVDTTSGAPVAGSNLTLKATLLAADGSEVKGASFAWTSSDESVAVVTAASDKAPAGVSASVFVGTYATVQTRNAGEVDITATATLADGSRATSVTHLVVQAAPAKSYTLTLSPANLTVTAGAAPQTVTAAVRRSDGVDGIADLTNWTWNTADATFPVTAAADGHSAQVSSPSSATLAGSAVLAACADAPTGTRLCANAALARPAAPPPTYSVGGTVSGLAAGKSLQLAGVNGDAAVVSADGAFTVSSGLADASNYTVTVFAQPAGQTCTIQNDSGTIAAANVTNVAITCVQAQFVVVANRLDRTLSVYRIDPVTGALAAVPDSPFPTVNEVNDIAFLPSGRVGYAVMVDNNAIVPFQLDAATGRLTMIAAASAPTPLAPQVVAVDPTGRYVYVGGVGTLTSFAINPVTQAAELTSSLSAGGSASAGGVAVSADGQNVYATSIAADALWHAPVSAATGSLTFAYTRSSLGLGPMGAALSLNGSALYFANRDTNSFGSCTLDATGAITSAMDMLIGVSRPVDVAVTPSGQFVYVLGTGSNNIQTMRIDPTFGPLPLAITPASINGQRLRIEPNGRFLYTPSLSGTLYGFAIDATSGALTPVPGSPFATGNINAGMAIVQPTP